MEKKLIELRESKADEFTVKLLEENIASRKKLAEEQLKNGKEKIELKLKEHWKNGKLTTKERDTLVAILCADLEVGETSFKLSEKDKDGKDVKTIKKLSDVIDAILSDRPVIVELKEIAIKELKEPPEDNSKELEEKEATEIGSRVAGKVTKATKTAKKLAETE